MKDLEVDSAVSVVGLGKLGTCMAAGMAHRQISVVGVDLDRRVVENINAGDPPIHEPGLAELLEANSERVRATTDYGEAVSATDATFIIVPTPSELDGGFSMRHVSAVGEELGDALRAKDAYHLVVLTSTVLPGATEGVLKPILERVSGGQCGTDFGLCYSPQLIALGSVLRDFLHPDLVLLGESDARAGDVLSDIYARLFADQVAIQRMAIANAELTKIALNTYVTTKITFANMLAEMCESISGGDIDTVTEALGMDSRIGGRYLSAGLGFGGPCFPRDNNAFRTWSAEVGAPAHLAVSTDALNHDLGQRMLSKVSDLCRTKSTVAVLGLSYKAGTPVLEGSVPLQLATGLLERGIEVVAYDPLAEAFQVGAVDNRLRLVKSLSEALERADVVVVANPDPEFARIEPDDLVRRPVVVVDCWRLLRKDLESVPWVKYIGLGLAVEAENMPIASSGLSASVTI